MVMKIFNNGIDEEKLTFLQQGFLSALVKDAENNLKDDWTADQLGLSDGQYEKLKEQSFSIDNISPEALEKGEKIVDDFVKALNENQREIIDSLNAEDQRDFGSGLYDALLYDSSILPADFRDAIPATQHVDESGTIGMSEDGDIRIFFE